MPMVERSVIAALLAVGLAAGAVTLVACTARPGCSTPHCAGCSTPPHCRSYPAAPPPEGSGRHHGERSEWLPSAPPPPKDRPGQETTPGSRPGERVIRGSALVPSKGKPMIPVDVAWSISVIGDRAEGTITLTNHGPASTLRLQLRPVAGLSLHSASGFSAEVAAEATQDFSFRAGLAPGRQALSVTVTQEARDSRSRSVLIELAPDPAAAQATQIRKPADDEPLRGSATIIDDQGQRLELHPAR